MSTTTVLNPYSGRFPTPTVRYLCTAWWTCYSTPRHTWRSRCDLLLATSQPLSVIPAAIRQMLDLVIKPVSGWRGQIPFWFGIPCRIGRAALWLPIQENPGEYREFSLLVLLPQRELKDAPPFIHLGTQSLLEYGAQVFIDGSSISLPGKISIP
jgi:hypothetical protein